MTDTTQRLILKKCKECQLICPTNMLVEDCYAWENFKFWKGHMRSNGNHLREKKLVLFLHWQWAAVYALKLSPHQQSPTTHTLGLTASKQAASHIPKDTQRQCAFICSHWQSKQGLAGHQPIRQLTNPSADRLTHQPNLNVPDWNSASQSTIKYACQ